MTEMSILQNVTLLASALAILVATPSLSRERNDPLNNAPFSQNPCSVLAEGPCTPSFCGVFNDGPCVPDLPFPYGSGDLRLTIESEPKPADAARYQKPDHDLNTLGNLFAMLRSC